jgi:RNA polymerase sigma factor (sigma-70 family)
MQNLIFFSDRQYIERIRLNDREVLGEIFLKYQGMVLNYVLKHGGKETDAEDILQEAIIVLWQKVNAGNFQLTSRLGTYLMGIAKNKWLAQLRKDKRLTSDDNREDPVDDNPSSLERLLTDEKIKLVRRALEVIQPLCKKLLMLFYFEEKNMNDIAKIMNFANTDVVKSKKYQCKKALEEVIQKEMVKVEGKNL